MAHYRPVRRNIFREPLRESCVGNESESVQSFYGSGLRDSSVPRGSYSSRSLGNEDHIEVWQQGELLPTTPVQNFYGSGPRGTSRGSNSRSRLQDDGDQQEDHLEVRQQGEMVPTTPVQNFYGSGPRATSSGSNSRSRLQDNGDQQEAHLEVRQQRETLPTTSRASFSGSDVLANEVARLKMTVDLILEGQRSMEKSFDELRSRVQKFEEGLHGQSATQRRKRRTPLSLQVKSLGFYLKIIYVSWFSFLV